MSQQNNKRNLEGSSRFHFNRQHFNDLAPVGENIEIGLASTVKHSLSGDGSFSRAVLASGTASILGISSTNAEKLGTGIELFHLASLLLDDLPCMDDATVRRARPCAHLVYGESAAILGALGFINRAYFLLWEVFADENSHSQMEAAKLMEQCLGLVGILNGQAKDIRFLEGRQDAEDVLEIARLKTGSLLRLCLLLPVILSGADRILKLHMTRLADFWGMAYQISDDLKDIFLGENLSGKTACRDEALGRPNLPLAIGTDAAIALLTEFLGETNHILDRLKPEYPDLHKFLKEFQTKLESSSRELLKAHAAA